MIIKLLEPVAVAVSQRPTTKQWKVELNSRPGIGRKVTDATLYPALFKSQQRLVQTKPDFQLGTVEETGWGGGSLEKNTHTHTHTHVVYCKRQSVMLPN